MKPRMLPSLILALALAIGSAAMPAPRAHASGWWRCVNPGGTDGCYSSIQTAINDSSPGDSINVWAGTYSEHIILSDGVSIYGAGWDKTIINGKYSKNYSTVMVPSTVGAGTLLAGVQITGGGNGNPQASSDGGGIWIAGSPTISDTWIHNNTGYLGGGLTVWGGSPTLVNVPAWGNQGLSGGGFYFDNHAVVTITSDTNGTDGTVWGNSANNSGGGFYIGNATVTLSGLRVWWNSAPTGGGIYSTLAPNLQIRDNTFNWNSARSAGGGVYLDRSAAWLSDNGLFGNVVTGTGSLGGGAIVTGTSGGVTFEHNWFEANTAVQMGGGLELENGAVASVDANTIVSNTAYGGAGVSVNTAGVVTITNNLVARNVALAFPPGGLYINATAARIVNNTIADNTFFGIQFDSSNGIIIGNNIVSGNGVGIRRVGGAPTYTADYNDLYNDIGGHYDNVAPGSHDLSADPAFRKSGNLLSYYHLTPLSPAIDHGHNWGVSTDVDGDPRPVGAGVDIGFDEFQLKKLFLPIVVK